MGKMGLTISALAEPVGNQQARLGQCCGRGTWDSSAVNPAIPPLSPDGLANLFSHSRAFNEQRKGGGVWLKTSKGAKPVTSSTLELYLVKVKMVNTHKAKEWGKTDTENE